MPRWTLGELRGVHPDLGGSVEAFVALARHPTAPHAIGRQPDRAIYEALVSEGRPMTTVALRDVVGLSRSSAWNALGRLGRRRLIHAIPRRQGGRAVARPYFWHIGISPHGLEEHTC